MVETRRNLWQLLHKGDKIYVEGRELQTRDWKSDDGQEKKILVVIENMILRSAGNGGDADVSEREMQKSVMKSRS